MQSYRDGTPVIVCDGCWNTVLEDHIVWTDDLGRPHHAHDELCEREAQRSEPYNCPACPGCGLRMSTHPGDLSHHACEGAS